MRRATATLLGTMAGTALLVGAKYGTAATTGAGDTVADSRAGSGEPSSPGPSGSASGSASPGAPSAPGSASPGAPPAGTAPTTGRSTAPGTGGGTTKPPAPAPTTAAPACRDVSGAASTVASPGVGAMTVTIKVCNGAVTASTGSLSQSNWSANNQAIPQLNTLAVQYYKTDISKIAYSGATLTAKAYQASLRSAISKAGI